MATARVSLKSGWIVACVFLSLGIGGASGMLVYGADAKPGTEGKDARYLLIFKGMPPQGGKERNFYELAREIKQFFNGKFPPAVTVTSEGVRHGVFSAKKARVVRLTDSRQSPRSPKAGVHVLVYDRIYTICAKSYTIGAVDAGARKISYLDCENGQKLEFPVVTRGAFAIYELELTMGNILRELWQEKQTK